MRTSNTPPQAARAQQGFTLIELMVSLLLGLVTILVITHVLFESEGRRRTVAMGGDAQTNGAMALYTLQRDIQMSGYGLTASPDALGCDVKAQFGTFSPFSFTLAPVVINYDPAGGPDSVIVLRGRTARFSVPMTLSEDHPAGAERFLVTSSFGAAAGNMMVAVPKKQDPASAWCSLISVTNDDSDPNKKLSEINVPHVAGVQGAEWNRNPAPRYLKNDYLLNMESLVLRTYSINGNNLQMTERSSADGSLASRDLYPQIVTLQAMYGKGGVDAGGNVHVDSYDKDTPKTNADWRSVVSIRIALVARSNQYEKDKVTTDVPKWDVGSSVPVKGVVTSTCNGTSTCIDLIVKQQVGNDWEHYRYKVFDTIVPLRNVLWNAN